MPIRTLSTMLAVGGACAALGACGGDDQPAYCSSVTEFQDAVSGLADVQVVEDGTSSLTAAVDEVESSGQKLVADAKAEFAPEADALNASIMALGTTVEQLKDPQARKAAVPAVQADIQSVQASYDALSSAVGSKCD